MRHPLNFYNNLSLAIRNQNYTKDTKNKKTRPIIPKDTKGFPGDHIEQKWYPRIPSGNPGGGSRKSQIYIFVYKIFKKV